MNKQSLTFVCVVLLVLSTVVAYWQVQNNDFINFDDGVYVSKNRHVQEGGWNNIIWAFTDLKTTANWHPITWLSHILDTYLFGLNPKGHHLTNLVFHIINTLLLFFFLSKTTSSLLRSGFVAALFALHPLHVESVAWISERKDVLSTFFWFLTLFGYIYFIKEKRLKRYAFFLIPFLLGLMSKPMLVSLPFVLLLLDYWPLGRLSFSMYNTSADSTRMGWREYYSILKPLFYEKVPLFILSISFGVIAYFAQDIGNAMQSLTRYPMKVRLLNAILAYGAYIKKMFLPYNLALFYPYPKSFSSIEILSVAIILLIISFIFLNKSRNYPYLIVGWLWYVGTLVPVIGLVQVGTQSMADRYTYIPLIGLFIILSWGGPDLLKRFQIHRSILPIIGVIILILSTILTRQQVRYWKDSITIFEHAIRVTKNNDLAYGNLGLVYFQKKDIKKAISYLSTAISIDPGNLEARVNLALALVETNRIEEAASHIAKALRQNPKSTLTFHALGVYYTKKGLFDKAIDAYNKALDIDPENAAVINDIGYILEQRGYVDKAMVMYKKAVKIQPFSPFIRVNLGLVYLKYKEFDKAIDEFKVAISFNPESVDAHNNLGSAFFYKGLYDRAIDEYKRVLELNPNDKFAHLNLGVVYSKIGMNALARAQYQKALTIDPDFQDALIGLKKLRE